MFDWLKNHPFAVDAFFESSTVLTFAVPLARLRPLLPPGLEPDALDGTWGFVAAAMVQTRHLRPAGLPAWLGNSFFLVGYRIFVRYTTPAGKRLRGLFILQSETDQRRMQWLGNCFTHYHYRTTDIRRTEQGPLSTIASRRSDFRVTFDAHAADLPLPAGSPFADWAQARRFAGPLPFTFSWLPGRGRMLAVEGRRENWTPRPLHVVHQHFAYVQQHFGPDAVLANAFAVRNIPYRWQKGRLL